jgi:hypothetical protein
MCGRYVRRSDKQKIAEHFAVHGPSLPDFGPSWNVAPQTFQPIVRLNRDTGERELVLMRWGLIPSGRRTRRSAGTLNAKAETPTAITRIIFKWLGVAPILNMPACLPAGAAVGEKDPTAEPCYARGR